MAGEDQDRPVRGVRKCGRMANVAPVKNGWDGLGDHQSAEGGDDVCRLLAPLDVFLMLHDLTIIYE